jgi:hypothetical protein
VCGRAWHTAAECPDDTGAGPDHAFERVAPVDLFAFINEHVDRRNVGQVVVQKAAPGWGGAGRSKSQ